MFKKIILLTLPLFALTIIPNINKESSLSYIDKTTNIRNLDNEDEDPNVLHGYTYVDEEQYATVRTFDSRKLAPTINEAFSAPNGYAYTLSIDESRVNEIFDQMEFVNASFTYINFTYYYGIYGTEVYSDSASCFYPEDDDDHDKQKSWMIDAFEKSVKNRLLLKIDNVVTPADLYLHFGLSFVTNIDEEGNNHWWEFHFFSEIKEILPRDEYDYVKPQIHYYQEDETEKRINLSAILLPGFFNQYNFDETDISFNQYGWLTDTITDASYYPVDSETGITPYFCDYTFTLYAFETVQIGTMSGPQGGIELSYPKEPIEARLKLEFLANGENHIYYSDTFILGNPNLRLSIDKEKNREVVQRFASNTYSVSFDYIPYERIDSIYLIADLVIDRLMDDGLFVRYCYDGLPSVGEEDIYYYLPSENEIALHKQNKDDEFLSKKAEGEYYYWDLENNIYYSTDSYFLINSSFAPYLTEENISKEQFLNQLEQFLNPEITLPIVGRFSSIRFNFTLQDINGGYAYIQRNYIYPLEVVYPEKSEDQILLNVPDNINLMNDGGSIEIIPSVTNYDESTKYYYSYSLNRENIIDVKMEENGKLIVEPLNPGVASITISVDSRYFNTLNKKVTFRVIEATYESASIMLQDEEIYVGKDVNCALNIRGLTNFQNIDIDWQVLNKKGQALAKEKIANNNDATMKIINPEVGDYTIIASYQDVELDRAYMEVRYLDKDVVSNDDEIILNVPDNVNLLKGAEPLLIVPSVSNYDPETDYYFDYEISRNNVIHVNESDEGLIIDPINAGVVTLDIIVSYEPYHEITKTINVRVLDTIYDVAKIEVNDEFHYAGQDLTARISIRGFTGFQNLNIKWEVVNKKGLPINEDQIIINDDASITIINPDSEDYTITASYEDVVLDTLLVKVRYVDMDKFLRSNIWWIFIITLGFVAVLIFLRLALRRSKTTVENIERVYQVFCQCLSDDKLTKDELFKIKKEITRCMHRCEDLNIDALNQYEKATRYLRKSLYDVKTLINNFDHVSVEERGVYTNRLDKDLAKALNVAKEIENAKGLIENYHAQANRHNFESLNDNKKSKNKDKI